MCKEFSKTQCDKIDEYTEALRKRVSKKRFNHSVSVSEYGFKLGKLYNCDLYDVVVAGLLHDWDKELPVDEQLRTIKECDAELSCDPLKIVPLLHGITASIHLPLVYPEINKEVLQAISRHTVGAVNMSDLDMVVFVSDMIEPLRNKGDVNELRGYVGKKSLKDLMAACMASSIKLLVDKKRYIYGESVDVWNSLL